MDVDEAVMDHDSSANENWTQHADCDYDNIFGDFLFTKTGQNVAVCYDDEFHTGSITSNSTPELAEVNFQKKCSVANNTYVWPLKPERAAVTCLFVFDCDFDIVTTMGRVWSVPSHDVLSRKYIVYN